jgi:hypothetical protein
MTPARSKRLPGDGITPSWPRCSRIIGRCTVIRLRRTARTPPTGDEESRATPASFNIREAPYARGYFVGDYMGLADANGDILSLFGSTDGGGPSSIFLRRLID